MGDLATLQHPEHSRGGHVRKPDSTRFVHRAAVGRRLGEGCPLTARARCSVSVKVEGGVALTECFAHNQGPTIGGDDRTVGEQQVTGPDVHGAIRSHHSQGCGLWVAIVGLDVPAEVPHVCGAVSRDHHVVAVPGGDFRKVGVNVHLAVHYTENLSGHHGYDEQGAVGHPPKPGGLFVAQVEHGFAFAVR